MDLTLVEASRLQFAITAIYHFLFVPLTLGLAVILGIMESIYVMTNREIWRDLTKFWGKLFAINFAMGVATGITMEFQFGTNWAYYSHYVGDIFGVPLAIEGLMAFFLESTFVGLFLFGWNKLSKVKHLMVTWLMAIGTNLSALWILISPMAGCKIQSELNSTPKVCEWNSIPFKKYFLTMSLNRNSFTPLVLATLRAQCLCSR